MHKPRPHSSPHVPASRKLHCSVCNPQPLHPGLPASSAPLPAGEKLPLEQLFTIPCDVFVPAAAARSITADVARQMDCKYVVEAANGPCTLGGDAVLRDRGITVMPDVLASGGGVVSILAAAVGLTPQPVPQLVM